MNHTITPTCPYTISINPVRLAFNAAFPVFVFIDKLFADVSLACARATVSSNQTNIDKNSLHNKKNRYSK